jgi:hypothetical protein
MYSVRPSFFYHLPKTAGTSYIYDQEKTTVVIRPDRTVRHNPIWWWEQQHKIEHTMENTKSIVRNPYDRAVSLWLYCSKLWEVHCTLKEFYTTHNFVDKYNTERELCWNTKSSMKDHLTNSKGKIGATVVKLENIHISSRLNANNSRIPYSNLINVNDKSMLRDIFSEDFKEFDYEI